MIFLLLLCDVSFLSSRRRHTISKRDWSSDVCSSDLSTKHYGIHFGVYRSSIRTTKQFTSVLQCVKQKKRIVLDGIMGYEAQLAGVPDKDPKQKIKSSVIRHLKRKSKSEVAAKRKKIMNIKIGRAHV